MGKTWLSTSIFFSKVHLTIHKNASLQNAKLPTWVWFVPQSVAGLWGQLRKVSELTQAVWKQSPALSTARLTADMWCVALDGFSVLPGWVCTDPQHPTELLCSQAPQLGWQLHRDGLGSAQNWTKGSLELGRNQRREGKNRRRKGSLASYDSVSSVLAEQQIGIKEGNPTALQKKMQEEIYPPVQLQPSFGFPNSLPACLGLVFAPLGFLPQTR